MSVATRWRIMALLPIVLGAAISAIVLSTSHELDRALQQDQELSSVSRLASSLALVSQELVSAPESPRVRQQWATAYRSLTEQVAAIDPEWGGQSQTMDRVGVEVQDLGELFARLTRPPATGDHGPPPAAAEQRWARLAGRILSNAQAIMSDIQSLAQAVQDAHRVAHGRSGSWIIVLTLGATLVLTLLALVIGRSVLGPLARLQQATEVIAGGDLDARVGTGGNDEIGRLSRSFDRVIDRLRQSLASREELEREIDLRKEAEAKARSREVRLRTLLDTIVDGIVVIDTQGLIQSVNPAAVDLFGHARDALLGQNVRVLMPEPYAHGHDEYLNNYLTTGVRKIIGLGREVSGMRKDGSTFPMDLAVSEMQVDGERLFIGVVRDITERKAADAQLHRTLDELSRSNEELQQFAYVASHDLQEPLRMVASYLQLLERRYKGRLDPDADEFIAYAVDGATRMKGLINDLLVYSRVGTKGKPFAPAQMEEVLAVALGNLGQLIQEQRAVVTHDPLPEVNGDAGQLVQLLQNLIGNAVKFHAEELPQVHVSARRIAEGEGGLLSVGASDGWCFCVHDNGIGIEPKYREQIFGIFKRLHGRGEYPGSGIGLAVCRKILARHGGSIWVESGPGGGSDFCFAIPDEPRSFVDGEAD